MLELTLRHSTVTSLHRDQEAASARAARVVRGDLATGSTRFALFFGHPRSGHSIVGSILDSHPDAVVRFLVGLPHPHGLVTEAVDRYRTFNMPAFVAAAGALNFTVEQP